MMVKDGGGFWYEMIQRSVGSVRTNKVVLVCHLLCYWLRLSIFLHGRNQLLSEALRIGIKHYRNSLSSIDQSYRARRERSPDHDRSGHPIPRARPQYLIQHKNLPPKARTLPKSRPGTTQPPLRHDDPPSNLPYLPRNLLRRIQLRFKPSGKSHPKRNPSKEADPKTTNHL